MAKKSLLEQAQDIPVNRRMSSGFNEEEVEVALAWISDSITLTQASIVLGFKTPGSCVSRLSLLLREAYRAGILKRAGR